MLGSAASRLRGSFWFLKLACLGVLVPAALAQTANPTVGFEAASVKPAGPLLSAELSGMHGGPGTDDPGRITIPRATLSDLLARAYDVWIDQISGPTWLNDPSSYAYRIEATLPPDTTPEQLRLMLQNLLAERFHIRLHHDTKVRPGYELVVANGGPKLKQWTPSTDALGVRPGVDRNGFLRLPAGATKGIALPRRGVVGPIRLRHRETMAMFCLSLGPLINMAQGAPIGESQARVVDMTGLTGTYEFTLEFAGSLRSGSVPPVPAGSDPAIPSASDPAEGAPDLFTALEKQLGLKLLKVRDIPVDVLIVDKADKVPTEN